MADGTVKRAVLALARRQLRNLGRVAVEAVRLALERYIQRRMGFRMAVEAAHDLEMGLSCLQVAFIARRGFFTMVLAVAMSVGKTAVACQNPGLFSVRRGIMFGRSGVRALARYQGKDDYA
jgi:hypothetical protein